MTARLLNIPGDDYFDLDAFSASAAKTVIARSPAHARANSRKPSSPWIRPNPESPTPPNGNRGSVTNDNTELTETMPVRMRRARSMARERPNTAPPSP